MEHKIAPLIEAHPMLAWATSALSIFLGWLGWVIDHAHDFAKVFGMFAALFGMIAGYYTMRVQKRAYDRWRIRKND
jgi:hypothetical protein